MLQISTADSVLEIQDFLKQKSLEYALAGIMTARRWVKQVILKEKQVNKWLNT